MTTTPAAHPAKDLRGKECEVLDGNPDSPTHGQWLKARFVSVDLIGQEPIVQVDGCMPWFATWASVRGITKTEAIAPGQHKVAQPFAWAYMVADAVYLHKERTDDYYSLDDGDTKIKGVPLYLAATLAAPGQPGYVTRPPYPKGLTVMPEVDQEYWVVDVDEPMKTVWDGHPDEGCFFNAGLCYPATPEGEADARLAWEIRFGEGWK